MIHVTHYKIHLKKTYTPKHPQKPQMGADVVIRKVIDSQPGGIFQNPVIQ